ncbi:hypothetical protein C6Q28_28245 [Burkholderia multivorans]|uniref:Glycosyltransferase family 1 protein n=2 Tax=Burkholderia multivorans TaxID=87883 RepID=A0A0H3KKW7_BURM1|nr:hypothetical protein [Burkholderia multivorans]ABX16301.1 hypothetical protein Bmul_2617 [Burkholderia multivorans ATCC 17616]MBU9127311.1 hypothetical protein [Burkholderia multivorans]PRE53546.1 hypothetical protein C6P97_05685 [Burkholderia multivorans]PRE53791.1 hypothetical protein C6P99_05845 [Burkholderia multivorans]PRE86555.1 hypothetical protein C6Q02_09165 [Burkholderia multivorans]
MLRRLLYRKPAHGPSHLRHNTAVQRWLVLHQGDNPSTDYYVLPRLQEQGLPVVYKNLDTALPQPGDLAPGTAVVIIRYLNARWARALRLHRAQLSRVVYFMDDDLLHPRAWAGLPRPYVKKLRKYCHAHTTDIRELSTEYWFSTQELRDRYPERAAQLIAPRALLEDARRLRVRHALPEAPILVFYHGSAAHEAEIAWLQPIVAQVLARCPNVHFELIGAHAVNALYRSLPRTRVVHPMGWANYRAHCRLLDGHIGLAPLLPSAFNAARSHVKAYDIARCRAVGLYAAPGPYQAVIRHGENGLLLDNDPHSWVEALCALAGDPVRLHALRVAAQELLLHPSAEPSPTIDVVRDAPAQISLTRNPAGSGAIRTRPDVFPPTRSTRDSAGMES